MKLDVPFYSQKSDVIDPHWQQRACGVTCVKMVLDFYKKGAGSIDDLIKRGVEIGAYGPYGWIHHGLIDIAGGHGLILERREYKSDDKMKSRGLLERGVDEIVASLLDGRPVLVSAIKKFIEKDKFHMMLLVGFDGDSDNVTGFYYHDPDVETKDGGKGLFVDIETFKREWRKMAIFVHH